MKKISFLLIFVIGNSPALEARKLSDKAKRVIGTFVGGGLVLMVGVYRYKRHSQRDHYLRKPLLSSFDGDKTNKLGKLLQRKFSINRVSNIKKLIGEGADPNGSIFTSGCSTSFLELALDNNLSLRSIKALVDNGTQIPQYIVDQAQLTQKPQAIVDYLIQHECSIPHTSGKPHEDDVHTYDNPLAGYATAIYDLDNPET